MLDRIINFSIKNKIVVFLLLIVLVIVGIYQATRLPIDAVPDITNNQVQIITVAPSYGALDIERMVTFPIEQSLQKIKGLEEIRSFSRFGLSLVTVVFKDDIDIYWARQQITENLSLIQRTIPKEVGIPELAPISTGLGEVYQYVVRPEKGYEHQYDITELRTIQDWIVRRHLLGIEGVAEVSSFGGKLKQYEVSIDPQRLNAMHVSLSDVYAALEKNNSNSGGTYIEKGDQAIFIRSEGLVKDKTDIENVFVKMTDNHYPILIKDVAKISIGYATRYGAMCFNDKGEVAGAVVLMLKGENSNEVIKRIKRKIAEIEKLLPEGVRIDPFIDRTKIIHSAISTVSKNLMEGALIVICIVIVFLGQIRGGLIVASVIPLSILFAITMMNLFGVSGNLMSLGAIDFGLIVDGAVIIVEAVLHQMSKRNLLVAQSPQVAEAEVQRSASKMMNSAAVGQLIILVVYLPIFTLQGIEGKMFIPMAQTVCFALLGAFLLSISYIPMMSAVFLARTNTKQFAFSERLFAWLVKRYEMILFRSLRYSKAVISITLGLFVLAVIAALSLGGEFIPTLEEGDFAIDTRVISGSNLKTTIAYTQKVSKVLLDNFPEVEKIVTKIGSSEVPTDPMPIENADIIVTLRPKKEWKSARTFAEMENKMRAVIQNIPGIKVGFQFPVQMRFNELMSGARQDVVCKIFGEDLETLADLSQKIGSVVGTVQGVRDIYVEPLSGSPQIIIRYDRIALAHYGLDIDEANAQFSAAFAGRICGIVLEGEKRFDLVARLDSEKRTDIEDVKNLLIATPNGTQVPLKMVANITQENSPNQIQREQAKRRVMVGFNVKERDVKSVVADIQKALDKQVKLPSGYLITFGGNFENLEKATQRLYIAVPIALLLIFLIIFFNFKSLKTCLLIYSAIPLSSMGGIFLLVLRGMPFSISAGIGFIALFGVAVLNSIVLVAEFNQLKKSGINDHFKLVIIGAKTRLRPVLMTAIVASLGFLPMALSNDSGAEVQRPLATVVIGGLLFSTLLTLVVLPILYIRMNKKNTPSIVGKKTMPALLVLLALGMGYADLHAQENPSPPLNLSRAIDSAMKNNVDLRNAQLQAQQYKALRGTAVTLNPTQVTLEEGNVNSALNDDKWTVSQSFAFPLVYTSKAKSLRMEWERYELLASKKRAEIIRDVSSAYYDILVIRERLDILQRADSILNFLFKQVSLREAQGDVDLLEKSSIHIQQLSLAQQFHTAQVELHAAERKLQQLLGTKQFYPLETSPLKATLGEGWYTGISPSSTSAQIIEQTTKQTKANLNMEWSQLLPSFLVGYTNQTFTGMGADERYYSRSSRFNAFQVGVEIPIFFNSQAAKIKSARIQHTIAQLDKAYNHQRLEVEFKNTSEAYQNHLSFLSSYEAHSIDDAKKMWDIALRQYVQGMITYRDLMLHINQALDAQISYLNTIKKYNETIFQLNYLAQ